MYLLSRFIPRNQAGRRDRRGKSRGGWRVVRRGTQAYCESERVKLVQRSGIKPEHLRVEFCPTEASPICLEGSATVNELNKLYAELTVTINELHQKSATPQLLVSLGSGEEISRLLKGLIRHHRNAISALERARRKHATSPPDASGGISLWTVGSGMTRKGQ
jgi:hypothetical protein